MWHLYFKGWWQLCSSENYFHFAKGKVLLMIIALLWEGWDMKPCTQNCLLVTDNSFNECLYYYVQAYFTLLCTWFYWMLLLVFFFAYLAKNIHAITHVHTHTHTHTHPSKSKAQFGFTASASVSLFVCACVGVWGGGLHMHVGVHTCVCALCYQLKVHNVSEVPVFALHPQSKTVQLAERLWKENLQYTCTSL